jgi:hypothetical protein
MPINFQAHSGQFVMYLSNRGAANKLKNTKIAAGMISRMIHHRELNPHLRQVYNPALFYNDQNQPDWQKKKALLQACLGKPTIEDVSGYAFLGHPNIEMSELIHGKSFPLP